MHFRWIYLYPNPNPQYIMGRHTCMKSIWSRTRALEVVAACLIHIVTAYSVLQTEGSGFLPINKIGMKVGTLEGSMVMKGSKPVPARDRQASS
jgi:hypothetical protein